MLCDNYASKEVSVLTHLAGSVGRTSEHTIKDFLARPVILHQGTWDQSKVNGDELWSAEFPSALLTSTFIQNIRKVDGFVGMRAKVRIRIQFNSQPFQAGLAILSFFPYSEYNKNHSDWFYKSEPNSAPTKANMLSVSALPHVLLNLANQTAFEFITPYISPYLYVNLVTGQGSFGKIALNVFTPVLAAASSTVNFTVWGSFEDVELVWPTDAPLATKWAQVGGEMAQMERTGTISSVVGSVGGTIAKVLPYVGLSSLAKPVELFSTTAENVMRMFGFSKPSVQAPVTRVLQSPGRYFLNCDGSDTSHKLGLSAGNELQTFSGFAGTDHDEMALAYVVSRPSYYTDFDWTTANAADTQIFSQYLSPTLLAIRGSPTTVNKAVVDSNTPASRVAQMFDLWRGDFIFDFHFVKTQMHSGRVRISTRLYSYESTSTSLNDMPGYTETADIDLSSASVVRFRVPYAAVRPWLMTQSLRATTLTSTDLKNYCMGQIQMTVVNPLVAAPSASSTVKVVAFVHMENASFAVPLRSTYIPYGIPNQTSLDQEQDQLTKLQATAQVGGVVATRPVTEDQNSQRSVLIPPHSMCIGEVVTSFRQLLKRFSPCYLGGLSAQIDATATVSGASGTMFTIRPWASCSIPTGPLTPVLPNYPTFDLYSQIMPLYAFSRGSMRFKIVLTKKSATFDPSIPLALSICLNTTAKTATNPVTYGGESSAVCGPTADIPATTPGSLAYQQDFAEPTTPIFFDKEGVAEFEVPYYSTGHMVATYYGPNDLIDRRNSKVPIPQVVFSHPQLLGCNFTIYRAVGDDFSFGGLLGATNTAEYNYFANQTA